MHYLRATKPEETKIPSKLIPTGIYNADGKMMYVDTADLNLTGAEKEEKKSNLVAAGDRAKMEAKVKEMLTARDKWLNDRMLQLLPGHLTSALKSGNVEPLQEWLLTNGVEYIEHFDNTPAYVMVIRQRGSVVSLFRSAITGNPAAVAQFKRVLLETIVGNIVESQKEQNEEEARLNVNKAVREYFDSLPETGDSSQN